MYEVLIEAFRHAAWATHQLIQTCREPSFQQMLRVQEFGNILRNLDHVITSDAHYVTVLSGAPAPDHSEDPPADLERMVQRVDKNLERWEQLLSEPIDAERQLILDDGAYECRASVVILQALHHGTAHREQVRKALKDLKMPPKDLQPWEGALQLGLARWTKESS